MARKKKDPAAAVLEYFRTAPPEVVRTVLALAIDEVSYRLDVPKVAKPKKQKKAESISELATKMGSV